MWILYPLFDRKCTAKDLGMIKTCLKPRLLLFIHGPLIKCAKKSLELSYTNTKSMMNNYATNSFKL